LLAVFTLALGPTISRLTLPEQPSRGAAFSLEARVDHAAMHHTAMDAGAMHAHRHHAASSLATSAPPPARTAPSHHHTLEHCALCAVAATAFAVASSPPVVVAAFAEPRPVAVSADRGLAPGRTPWSPATSRGPPVLG